MVVLAAAPYKVFELDRFFVPKELALHLTALLASLALLARVRRASLARVDQLLLLFLALGACSALFATNWWSAERAVALSLSGAACFWCARALARAGHGRALIATLAAAGAIGAATSLLQTYGLRIEYFSLNRAPGGTFGNRNFMAHLCVITFPALVFATLRANSRIALRWWYISMAIVCAGLIVSRSRAAWLALIAGALVLIVSGWFALRRRERTLPLRRLAMLAVAGIAGSGAALVLPNTLDWKSDSPYMDTARSVVNYKAGSGHGRLVQYGNSLRMSLHHPVLGVGPGNWAVVYPKFASTEDPSLGEDGMTSNPWPSSDWVTFLSERGVAACVILLLAVIALATDGARGVARGVMDDERVSACALLGTLATLVVVGSFDAVLLLPVPALIGWTLLGALSPPSRARRVMELPLAKRALVLLVATAMGGIAVARSVSQLSAMSLYSTSTRLSLLERSSRLDPGSYRIHLRLAESYIRRGSCEKGRGHAAAAHALFPEASAPRRLLAQCGR